MEVAVDLYFSERQRTWVAPELNSYVLPGSGGIDHGVHSQHSIDRVGGHAWIGLELSQRTEGHVGIGDEHDDVGKTKGAAVVGAVEQIDAGDVR